MRTDQRGLLEIDHEGGADAVDQIGKIFAEIEAGSLGHELRRPAKEFRWTFFMGLLPRCQSGTCTPPRSSHSCIYNSCKCTYNAWQQSTTAGSTTAGSVGNSSR